jgi:hypothetical protein
MAEDQRAQLERLRAHSATLRDLPVWVTQGSMSGHMSRGEEVTAITAIIRETNTVGEELTALVSPWSEGNRTHW